MTTSVLPVRRTALVTGASRGVGEQLARRLAELGVHLLLVARSADKLEALAAELRAQHGITVHVLALDLTDPGAAAEIERECQFRGLQIDFLINNAGFADYGELHGRDLGKQLDMLALNIAVTTELTRRFLPGMLQRGQGRILNLASIAAFFPGPLMTVYYASKAYVLSLSEGLNEELRGSGVAVTALCPGPMETGFKARANMQESRVFHGPGLKLRLSDPAAVARQGIEAMIRGDAVCIPGALNQLQTFLPRLTPRWLVPRMVKFAQQRRGKGRFRL